MTIWLIVCVYVVYSFAMEVLEFEFRLKCSRNSYFNPFLKIKLDKIYHNWQKMAGKIIKLKLLRIFI